MDHIAEEFTSVTPYLIVDGAGEAIAYYEKVFGATERLRMDGPGGSIMHAEIDIGGSVIMLGDANPDWGFKSPKELGGTPVSVFVYVPDVDATMAAAVANGGSEKSAAEDMFWGDRLGKIIDPFGHEWGVATHVEDVAPEEMAKRQEAMMKEMMGG